jgi:hypothetical protein
MSDPLNDTNNNIIERETGSKLNEDADKIIQQKTLLQQDDQATLSKNQLKKKRRHEKLLDQKKRRKLQDKEIKYAKAIADGRDLIQERKELEERKAKGDGHERREKVHSFPPL